MKKLILLATLFTPTVFAESEGKQIELTYQVDNSIHSTEIWLAGDQPTQYRSIIKPIGSGLSVNITPLVDKPETYVISYVYKGTPEFTEIGEQRVLNELDVVQGTETVNLADGRFHCFDTTKSEDNKPLINKMCLKQI